MPMPTDEYRATPRAHIRIDSQTTLSMALVILLLGGGIQYGRQSERLDSVERQLAAVTAKLDKLTEAIGSLKPQPIMP